VSCARTTDPFAVWIVDSGGPKDTQVESGGANMLTLEGTLVPPGEYG